MKCIRIHPFFLLAFVWVLFFPVNTQAQNLFIEHIMIQKPRVNDNRYFVNIQIIGYGDKVETLIDTGATGDFVINGELYEKLKKKGLIEYTGRSFRIVSVNGNTFRSALYNIGGIVIGSCIIQDVTVNLVYEAKYSILGMGILARLKNTKLSFKYPATLSFSCLDE